MLADANTRCEYLPSGTIDMGSVFSGTCLPQRPYHSVLVRWVGEHRRLPVLLPSRLLRDCSRVLSIVSSLFTKAPVPILVDLLMKIGLCRGYFCQSGPHCILTITSSTFPTVTCSAGTSLITYMSIPYTASDSSSSRTVISTFSAVVPMLQMLYRASDVSTTTTATTAVTSSAQTFVKHGLGVGAAVGIAIGVALFLAVIGSAVFWVWRRKRKARQGSNVKHELDGHERSGSYDAKNKPTEIDSGNWPRGFGRNDGSVDNRNQPMTPVELQ